jgi:hypothetical protein
VTLASRMKPSDRARRLRVCAALMRVAGNALARFCGHDEAARTHSALARRHFERGG